MEESKLAEELNIPLAELIDIDNAESLITTNTDSLATVVSSDIKVIKDVVQEALEAHSEEKTSREIALDKMKEYEETNARKVKLDSEIADLEIEIRKACPEMFDKLDKLNEQLKKEEARMKEIATESTPFFAQAVREDEDNKTLLYGKIQATYVYATEKHQFDLKSFIEEQNDFYTEHLSLLDSYSTISKVSDYVKYTIKKK